MTRHLPVALLLGASALSLIACSSDDNGPDLSDDAVKSLQGHWERRGYGVALAVEGATVTRYDFTTNSCLLAGVDTLDAIGVPLFSADRAAFETRDAPLAFAEHYERIESLPVPCLEPIGDTPSEIHHHLWSTFNEYYAFFEERNIDWLAQWDATRDAIRSDMTADELFDVLSRMLEPIDDQHVRLASPGASFDPGQPKGFLAELQREFDSQSETTDLEGFIAQELALWQSNIETSYLGGEYDSAGGAFDDLFTWGIIDDGIGYLRIDLMLLNVEQAIAAQVEQVGVILDEALQALANTDALILDIRMNPGGTDPVAFAIASRFADTQGLAVSKFTRSILGQGAMQSISLTPVDRPGYRNPVVLITSALTTSGAEVFTLAMRSLPQVTQLGEATNGALSDVLQKQLPNGWTFELSNEVYVDATGVSHEGTGIAPHVSAPVFDRATRLAGRDSALDAALSYLGVSSP